MTTRDEEMLLLAAACAAAALPPPEPPVEFRAIDQTAADDELPYSAHLLMQVRDNLERAAVDRIYSGGVFVPRVDGYMLEWSAPWATPVCLLRALVPESTRRARVRIRIADVLMEGGSADDPCISLCATAYLGNGQFAPPPSDRAAWTMTLEDGTEVAALRLGTDDDQQVVLDVLDAALYYPKGWVGAVVWVWSLGHDVALESGAVLDASGPWEITLDGSTQTLLVPHRALSVEAEDADQIVHFNREYAVGLLEQTGTAGTDPAIATVVPPHNVWAPAIDPLSITWQMWGLGYVELWGMVLEVDPAGPALPERDMYASRSRASGPAEQPLIQAVSQIVRSRVPTFGGCPVLPRGEGVPSLGWYVGDDMDVDQPSGLEADRRPLGSVLIPERAGGASLHPQPDFRGYTACVDILTWGFDSASLRGRAPLLSVRLAAYTVNGSLQFASDWQRVEHEWGLGSIRDAADPFEPVVAGAERYERTLDALGDGAWRWAGQLMGRDDDVGSTLRRVKTIEIEWSWQDPATGIGDGGGSPPTATPPGITYPIDLRVELKFDTTVALGEAFGRFYALAYCWIAALPRLVEAG